MVVGRPRVAAHFEAPTLQLSPPLRARTMLRRQSRERREYLFKKGAEQQETATFERKQALKASLATGQQLATELRRDARAGAKDLKYDEAQTSAYFAWAASLWPETP